MDLAALEMFVAVAEERSFSRAAERMFRTQPAVSLAVQRLEKELGEALFDRSRKTGTLTEAGRTLFTYARRLLSLRDEAKAAVGELKGMHRGRLAIGANESTSLYLLPPLLLAFRRRYPGVKIEVYRNVSERIPSEVIERNLDCGFLTYDPVVSALRSRIVHRDQLVLVVAPGHRLAGRKDVTVPELGRETFVAHNARTPARTQVFELFARHQTPLNITIELSTLETIKEFVARRAGAAILPRLALRGALESGELVEVPVDGLRIEKVTRVVYRSEEGLSHAARAFLSLLPTDIADAAQPAPARVRKRRRTA